MERTKQRTRKSMKGITAVFIMSSLSVTLQPDIYILPDRPFGDHDFLMSTYMRETGKERQIASKEREKQLFAEIRKIRQRIRLQAETYRYFPDRNTMKTIRAYTATEKTEIHCMKLVDGISNHIFLKNKKKQHESNVDPFIVDFNLI